MINISTDLQYGLNSSRMASQLKKVRMKPIGLTDSDDHTANGHDGKQMLTVSCFTTCHDLKEVADHTWGKK